MASSRTGTRVETREDAELPFGAFWAEPTLGSLFWSCSPVSMVVVYGNDALTYDLTLGECHVGRDLCCHCDGARLTNTGRGDTPRARLANSTDAMVLKLANAVGC